MNRLSNTGPSLSHLDWLLAVMSCIVLYALSASRIGLIGPEISVVASYVVILITSVWVGLRSRSDTGRSAPTIILITIFITALWLTTALVYAAELRWDGGQLPQQALALSLSMLPAFITYRAAKIVSPEGYLRVTAHLVAIISCLSVLLDVFGITHFESYGFRSFGFIGDSVAIALTFPIAVYAAQGRWAHLVITGICLLATLSRGPILVSVTMVIILILFSHAKAMLRSVFIVSIIGFILLFSSDRLSKLGDRYSGVTLDEGRFRTPLEGLRIFGESPLFGYGYNSIGYFHPRNEFSASQGIFPTASSPIVQMLSDGGVILFLSYLALLFGVTLLVFRNLRTWRSVREEAPLAGAGAWLLAILWINQSSTWFVIGSIITPVMFGAMGALIGSAHRRRTRRFGAASSIQAISKMDR